MRPDLLRRLIAPALAGALLLVLAPAAFAAPVATPGVATQIREYQGILVFSQFDKAAGTYRLAIRRPGEAPTVLPDVRPADRAFNADIGPDSKGDPELIYERCDETCDLFVYSLARPTGERAVSNANDPSHDDVAPTLWRGRIAWARIYGEQEDRKVIVYTKTLTAPRKRPSTRLPGVPQRRCGQVDHVCGPTNRRAVEELELWGDNLAQVVDYSCKGCSGTAQTELRLVDVKDRSAQQVAFQSTGLSGQSFVGPSFFDGRLGWYLTCLGDRAFCQTGGAHPFRFRISTREGFRAPSGPVVHGYVDTGAQVYQGLGCSVETMGDFNDGCRIEELPAPDFADFRLPRRG